MPNEADFFAGCRGSGTLGLGRRVVVDLLGDGRGRVDDDRFGPASSSPLPSITAATTSAVASAAPTSAAPSISATATRVSL